MKHRIGTCALVALVLPAVAACTAVDSARDEAGGVDAEKVVATVDGREIKMADLQVEVGDRLAEMDFEYQKERHRVLESALDDIVRRQILEAEAVRRGMTLQQLVAAETAAAVDVTDEEVTDWYDQNEATLRGQSLEAMFPRIQEFLVNMQRERVLRTLTRKLARDSEIEFFLEPVRADFDNTESPVYGPDDAPVTLVEFSDFECPFCGSFFSTLNEIKEEYGDRIRIVYRQFPLTEIHPLAWKAAEASLCAHEQGRFWEMHDLMFTEQDRLLVDDLKEKASRLGLDRAAFDACLDSGRYVERIERDIREGQINGVTGTPAIFLNGVQLPAGAIPYEAMVEFIEKELRRASAG